MNFPSIIDRYVFKEIFSTFMACFLVFMLTGLIAGFLPLLQKVMESGSGLAMALFRMLINALPGILVSVMPLALTIGVLMGLGRMAADNEIAAIKSAGVSIARLAPPVLIIALFTYAISMWLTLDLIPKAITKGRELAIQAASRGAGAAIQERTFFDKLEGLILYVGAMNPETAEMEEVFLRESTSPQESITIIAKTGRVASDPEVSDLILELRDGAILRADSHGSLTGSVAFRSYVFRRKIDGHDQDKANRSMEEMSIGEIRKKLETMDPNQEGLDPQSKAFYARAQNLGRVFIAQRFTYPLASLALAMVAFPLGLLNLGQSRLNNVSIGLVAIFIFYALTLISERTARSGLMAPEIILPAPALVFIVFGLYFTRCIRLERTPWIIRIFADLTVRLRGRHRR